MYTVKQCRAISLDRSLVTANFDEFFSFLRDRTNSVCSDCRPAIHSDFIWITQMSFLKSSETHLSWLESQIYFAWIWKRFQCNSAVLIDIIIPFCLLQVQIFSNSRSEFVSDHDAVARGATDGRAFYNFFKGETKMPRIDRRIGGPGIPRLGYYHMSA